MFHIVQGSSYEELETKILLTWSYSSWLFNKVLLGIIVSKTEG